MANWFCDLWDTAGDELSFWHDADGLQVRVEQRRTGAAAAGAPGAFIRMTLPAEKARRLRDWLQREFPDALDMEKE